MSLLREVKPRNARTARIVKAREPQLLEDRKKTLILHGSKCPPLVNSVLKTVHTLTKPDSVLLNKKNGNIHPFEDPASLEFLALKNDCGIVVFGTHSKKRPNNITIVRIFNGKTLDMVELLLLSSPESVIGQQLQIGVQMKPLMLFAGSQWDDSSVSESASLFSTLKSLLLDVFVGEEISSIDVAGLQYILVVAAGETNQSISNQNDPTNKPAIHLRWFRVRTLRSTDPKIPRVELDPIGPTFDFRVGRSREADSEIMKEAMKHGRRPNEARTKKNIETDLVGDKLGRVHLGKQDLSTLQTRKMKGLKRSRDDSIEPEMNGAHQQEEEEEEEDDDDDDDDDDEMISEDEDMIDGGMGVDDLSEGGSSVGDSGDEIDFGSDEEIESDREPDKMPKRQKVV